MLHLYHAATEGHTKACLRRVDNDVVVLAISHFHQLNLSKLWVECSSGKIFRKIPVHQIHQQLGPQCNAYTECDVTLFGIGKETAFNARAVSLGHWYLWCHDAITNDLISCTFDPLHSHFTVFIQQKLKKVQIQSMKLMFTHSLKSLDSIPPTQHTFY